MAIRNNKAHREKISYEKKLVSRCVKGNSDAWVELVDKYKRLIYSTIIKTFQLISYKINTEITEDLFQDVFALLVANNYVKLRSFKWKNGCSLASWLQVVTKNRTYDYIRKTLSHEEVLSSFLSRGEQTDVVFKDDSSWVESLMDDLEHETRIELFEEAIKKLPKDDQRLIEILYVKELPYQRAADILGKSIDALYMQKKRVIEKLKAIINKAIKKNKR
ncbi:MAG: sigma-70 family RNA polymerase sigma factor [Candidatus Omnitrophica bacterium]|nr:sigma-70 family RNA polymerase sigma factor [Candidatus Omnitrophota bacterium]